MVHSGIQSSVSPSSQPHLSGAFSIVLPHVPINVCRLQKQTFPCLIHMAECRWMFLQMTNTQEFVPVGTMLQFNITLGNRQINFVYYGVICGIRLQTANVFLWMLLKLDEVPQPEIGCKNQPLGCIAQPNCKGMSWYVVSRFFFGKWYPQCMTLNRSSPSVTMPRHLEELSFHVLIEMHGRHGYHPVVCYMLTWRINCTYISIGTEDYNAFQESVAYLNFTPGITRDYRLPASLSYTCSLCMQKCLSV